MIPVIHADGCTTNLGIIGATCNCGAEAQRDADEKLMAAKDAEIVKLKEESEARLEIIRRLTDRFQQLMASKDADMQRQLKEMVVKAREDVAREIIREIQEFHKLCGRQDMNELRAWQSLKSRYLKE